jgi:uncharacterized membrane protein
VKVLERTIEQALIGGLVLSAALLFGGLATGSESALAWGFILLMLTPVARVLVLAVALLFEKDFVFSVVSFFVLGVLGFGIWVAGFQNWPHSLPFR